MTIDIDRRRSPCGISGACDCCDPWGLGAAYIVGHQVSLARMACAMEQYWSAAYWARVLAELVHIGVLGVEISGEVALYHVTEPFRERLESLDDRGLGNWLDEHFAGWSREPDGPAWRE